MLLCGCTPKLAIDTAPVTKVPLHAGVYYSRQFLDATFMRASRVEAGFLDQRAVKRTLLRIPLGPPSIRVYDEVLGQLFEKVTRVEDVDTGELADKGIDLLVAPSLEHFDLPQGFAGRSNEHSIAYRTTLYVRGGPPLASWVVFGTADHSITGSATDLADGYMRGLAEAYIKDAGRQLLTDFERAAARANAMLKTRGEANAASSTLQNVSVAAKLEAFPGVPEAQAERLRQLGIVAIRVTAASPDGTLLVRASDMRLRLADGRLVEPEPVSTIAQVWRRISLEGAGDRAKPTPLEGMSSAMRAMVDPIGHVVGDAIVGNLSRAYAAGIQQQSSYQVVTPTLFRERRLGRGRAEHGFVFFQLSHPARVWDAVFTVWVVDPAAADGMQIEVRLPGPP